MSAEVRMFALRT